MDKKKLNCWEFKKCGREPGGKNVGEYGVCPSADTSRADGINQGSQGGRACWVISGTLCRGEIQGSFAKKIGNCTECEFYQLVRKEEGFSFDLGTRILPEIYTPEQLSQIYEQLHYYLNNIKEMQVKLVSSEKMASLGQMAAGVAHEINNPMAFVSSNLSMLSKYMGTIKNCLETYRRVVRSMSSKGEVTLDDTLTEDLGKVKNEKKLAFILEDIDQLISDTMDGVSRVKDIVLKLKKISRVDQASYCPVNINENILNALEMISKDAPERITFHTEFGDIPDIYCNPSEIEQALLNIIANAVDAIPENGGITIRTAQVGADISIRISDTGIGIPEAQIGKIFDPFYTTKKVGKGTGLGLAIAYSVFKEHNGTLAVESVLGKGTTFVVTLPVSTGPMPVD